MPRSSRHKSSKHRSREERDYSDSEKDLSLKERKAKEESASHRVSKESASGDKRKYDSKPLDSKDLAGSGNVDFVEEYGGSSSKKRKEKVNDDRWAGGDTYQRESSKAEKDLKRLSDSKSRSRKGDERIGLAIDVDEGKRSGGKVDSKHHKSERKERSDKEGGLERDRKGKEYSISNILVDDEAEADIVGGEGCTKQVGVSEDRAGKHISNDSGAISLDTRRNPDHDGDLEKRFRRKDGSNDVDKYLDVRSVDQRRLSSRDEIVKSRKYRDVGHEDNKYRDKHGEDEMDSRDEKQQNRGGCHVRDYVSSRSDEKYMRNETKDLDIQTKKSKHQDSDRDNTRSHYIRHHDDSDVEDRNWGTDHDRDGDHDARRDLDRDRGHNHDRDRGRDFDRDRDRDRERERYRSENDRVRNRDRARDRDFSHEHSKEWDHDHDRDYTSHMDDKSSRYKDDRSHKRSPDYYGNYYSDKGRTVKPVADQDKSVSRRSHSEVVAGSTRGRTSPSFRSHINMDKYRDNTHDDFAYGDSGEVPATPDRSSKYLSSDKSAKLDDIRVRDPYVEKSPRMKISPTRLLEKSPSSTSIDRKYAKRSGRRQSFDVDEAERRSSGSNDVRDGSINDGRQNKDLSSRKSLGEEHSPVESSFHHKSSEGNGFGHGTTIYKAGADGPSLMGSIGEDSRGHSIRYRRSVEPNLGRAHGNPWKGVTNWPTPLQPGFMPFPPGPHGPPHGGFPSIVPHFPSPSIFGGRPPMEMSPAGIPYHLPDADRFANHVRPLGWQNAVDGTCLSHFHGWDGNSGLFRDESPIFGPGSIPSGRIRGTNADVLKPNGDVKLETGNKDGQTKTFIDEALLAQGTQGSNDDSSQHEDQGKNVPRKSPNGTPIKKAFLAMTEGVAEKVPESPVVDDSVNSLRAYVSYLDISIDLTNPELYNEFVSLAVIEQSEYVEEIEDVNVGIAKTMDFEISTATMGISLFPAAEDSIFQRAIDLYETQSTNRSSFCMFDKDDSNSPASEMKVIEHAQGREEEQVLEKEKDELAHCQEIQGYPVKELSSANGQMQDDIKTVSISGIDEVADTSLRCEMEVEETVGMENISPAKPSFDNALNSSRDAAEVGIAVDEIGDNEPAPSIMEKLDSGKGGPLNLPHGSVKVCEGLMPVSNESESVTLTWVNHAPESTH